MSFGLPMRTRVRDFGFSSLATLILASAAHAETRPVLGDERWVCEWTRTSDNWGGTYAHVIVHKRVFLEYNPFVDKNTPQWKRTRLPYGPRCKDAEARRGQIFEKRGDGWFYKGGSVAVYGLAAAAAAPAPAPSARTAPAVRPAAPSVGTGAAAPATNEFAGNSKEGWHNDREFIHPELKIRFSYPQGYALTNSPEAVVFRGSNADVHFSSMAYTGDLEAYVRSVFAAQKNGDKSLTPGPVVIGMTNGLKSARSKVTIKANGRTLNLEVVAYEVSPSQAFHFIAVSSPDNRDIEVMYQSFSKLGDFEASDLIRRGPG